jgi:hypothetical protein
MVATKISEIAGKGWEWYSGVPPEGSSIIAAQPPSTPQRRPPPPAADSASSPSYWNYAHDSISTAAEQTYSTVAGVVSSGVGVVSSVNPFSSDPNSDVVLEAPSSSLMETLPMTPRKKTASLLMSPTLLNIFHNPAVSIRGGRIAEAYAYPPSSMEAVRSLLRVVPSDEAATGGGGGGDSSIASSSHDNNSTIEDAGGGSLEKPTSSSSASWAVANSSSSSSGGPPQQQPQPYQWSSSRSETASQLAEGTMRALRDIALDEAVELHSALRYWSHRWERPLLSWVEAGPTGTYKHKKVYSPFFLARNLDAFVSSH